MRVMKKLALICFIASIVLPFPLHSQTADVLLREGDEMYKAGKYEQAAESWKRALESDPKNLEAKQKLDKLYTEKYVNDKEHYEKTIKEFSSKKQSLLLNQKKEVTIDWDAVEGATKYLVQIKDKSGALLVDNTVSENKITFSVTPGDYLARVGAYNIFDKIGAWSDWTELKVVTPESAEAHPFPGVTSHGFMLEAGYQYSFMLSDYSDIYESSPAGWILRLGYQMKRLSIFESMPVLQNMHLECEIGRRTFTNRDYISNYDLTFDVNSVIMNVAYVSDFRFPVNVALRVGGGAAFSRQSIKMTDPAVSPGIPSGVSTTDPCYQFSASAVIDAGLSLFIEAGAGIFWVDYIEIDMKSVSLFCLAGIHI